MSVLLEKNGTTTAEVTMINARGILLFVGGKEYYLSYDLSLIHISEPTRPY